MEMQGIKIFKGINPIKKTSLEWFIWSYLWEEWIVFCLDQQLSWKVSCGSSDDSWEMLVLDGREAEPFPDSRLSWTERDICPDQVLNVSLRQHDQIVRFEAHPCSSCQVSGPSGWKPGPADDELQGRRFKDSPRKNESRSFEMNRKRQESKWNHH